jgi:hypothetical protein
MYKNVHIFWKNPAKRFERFGKYPENQEKRFVILMGFITIGIGIYSKSPVIFSEGFVKGY